MLTLQMSLLPLQRTRFLCSRARQCLLRRTRSRRMCCHCSDKYSCQLIDFFWKRGALVPLFYCVKNSVRSRSTLRDMYQGFFNENVSYKEGQIISRSSLSVADSVNQNEF